MKSEVFSFYSCNSDILHNFILTTPLFFIIPDQARDDE